MLAREIPRSRVERHLRTPRVPPLGRLALVLEVVVSYAQVRWLLARHDLPTVLTRLRGGAADAWSDDDVRELGLRLASPVRRVLGPLPFDSRCLAQSLVLLRMLSRRNAASHLVIGVLPGEQFAAHAWVEREGRALLPRNGFAPLTTL